jgi:hypothetical protein
MSQSSHFPQHVLVGAVASCFLALNAQPASAASSMLLNGKADDEKMSTPVAALDFQIIVLTSEADKSKDKKPNECNDWRYRHVWGPSRRCKHYFGLEESWGQSGPNGGWGKGAQQ